MKLLNKKSIYYIIIICSICNVLVAQTSKKIDWKNDLEIYKKGLEQKHIDVYHSITKEDFANEWQKIYNSSDTLNDFEIILKLMRLTRRINDGHTSVSLRNMPLQRFPLEVNFIDGEWRVVKVSSKHSSLLKLSLTAIDDIPIVEVSAKVSEVAQFVENQYSQKIRTGEYLNISELLFALHITKKVDKAVFTFLDDNNQEIKITLNSLSVDTSNKVSNFIHLTTGVPEITKPENPSFPYLWFTPIKNSKALYINFESYPTFEDMQVFGETLVNYIATNHIQKVIIDMRNNGGGDLYVGVVLAYALNLADSIDWKNGVFVLTSNKTFSAATSNAALYKQLLNAKIVGEPTGSNPNGYQDMDSFTLPNSKLVITYSKRLFQLSEKLNATLQPNIKLFYNWSDIIMGNDNILHTLIKNL
ncbi:S41 family peptidase [uncultured Lutibacter sp.]|uniref:S41 family peptidase n=1 Tax=uncultured Lutibacter sp. TaxID=437739 RepID=UPI0026149204|nr:S41 family peptidase [uncultured Lutibacter sp.]